MHTFSPAKMWISGLDALRTPLLHLHTQANVELPWSEIDMDFMNLNQAAHGDREFGYVQTRLGVARKTVAGHVSDPGVAARIGAWARAAIGHAEMRSLRLARFGDNMRDVAVTEGDKVEAELRFGVSVNTYGVNDLVEAVDAVADAGIDDAGRASTTTATAWSPSCARAATGTSRCATRARIEAGLRDFLDAGGFGAFTTNFEDLGGLRQLPGLAVQRLMADGYGFGGEGDWKTSVLVRTLKVDGRRHHPAAPRSWRTTPTTSSPARRRSSARTCWRSAPPSRSADPASRSTRWASAAGRTRYAWSSTPQPGPAVVSAWPTWATGSGWSPTRSTWSPRTSRCRSCRWPARCGSPDRTWPTSAEAWLTAGGPHHTVLSQAVGVEELHDFAEMVGTELLVIDADTTPGGSPTSCAGTRPTTAWPGVSDPPWASSGPNAPR